MRSDIAVDTPDENSVKKSLDAFADKDKAVVLSRFFKCGPGEYGYGDIFIGVTVPLVRKVAKEYYERLSPENIVALISSPVHEHRLAGLLMSVCLFQKGGLHEERAVDIYLASIERINNWDLVDLTAPKILGPWLETRER